MTAAIPTDFEVLVAAVAGDPGDAVAWSALTDLMAESGDPALPWARWAWANRKRPLCGCPRRHVRWLVCLSGDLSGRGDLPKDFSASAGSLWWSFESEGDAWRAFFDAAAVTPFSEPA